MFPASITFGPAFNWTTIFVMVLNLLLGSIFVTILKTRPAIRKIAADREANLLDERAKEMDSMRTRLANLEAKLEKKDVDHDAAILHKDVMFEAERALNRHQINNLSQCLDSFLMLVEQNPDKASAAAVAVRKMRDEQLAREAVEKAAIRAASLVSTAAAAAKVLEQNTTAVEANTAATNEQTAQHKH